MSLTLIEDGDWRRRYKLRDGKEITIELNNEFEFIRVTDSKRKEIGRFDISKIEADRSSVDVYKITWMYMDLVSPSYKRQGIGRACLQFFKDLDPGILTASDNDGITKSDGSHLTEDAPAFVHQMQKEGLIAKSKYEKYDF